MNYRFHHEGREEDEGKRGSGPFHLHELRALRGESMLQFIVRPPESMPVQVGSIALRPGNPAFLQFKPHLRRFAPRHF